MEETEAGLKGLCTREIKQNNILLTRKILYYNTTKNLKRYTVI